MAYQEFTIEGRNAVLEAFRAGKTIDKLFLLDGCKDGPILSIKREAAKGDCQIKYVTRERLDQMSETGRHQGVRRGSLPFYFFWTISRIRIIWARSSALPIWRGPME